MKNFMCKRLAYIFQIALVLIAVIFHSVGTGHADDPQGWDSAESTKIDYWVKKFSLPMGQLKKIAIEETFLEEGKVYQFQDMGNIYGLTVSGSIDLHSDNSLVRVILVDNNLQEYLVYESYPRIVENHSFSFKSVCEETCILDSMKPYSMRLDLVDASVTIDDISYADSTIAATSDIQSARKQIKQNHDAEKIGIINGRDLKWVAGETSISQLTYEEKKKLFGVDKVPNLQGAEFYKGGIFEIKSSESPPSSSGTESSLTGSFDWRNRHSANDPDSPYYDGDPTGSGWITSVKNQKGCGSCWAFAATGATEALANIYFNEHIDLDMSEQDALSCSSAGSCKGGWPGETLDYFTSDGVVDEACFPYTAQDDPCDICPHPDEIIKISGKVPFSGTKTEEKLKKMIIEHGPISGGIYSWSHAMTLVGYGKDTADGKTFWIFKNSWGAWGDHGYGYIKVKISDIGWTHALLHPVVSLLTKYQINCSDYDGDGYYNWGISKDQPASCPKTAYSEKDCDDSNPDLGPFAADGSCFEIFKNLLWQDQFDGTANGDDVANAIAVKGARIFVAGAVSNKGTAKDFTVRVYKTKTGKLLWQNQFDGTNKSDDEAHAIAVKGSQLFVAGKVTNNSTGEDFTVRAYNTKTGKLLWEDQFDGKAPKGNDQARAIAVSGLRVFAAGRVTNNGTDEDFTVRAYNTKTGKLLWQDQFNGTKNGTDKATAIAATSSQVFVAGLVKNKRKGDDFTVRAYNAKTGILLWQDQFDGTNHSNDRANAIKVKGSQLFVGGKVDNSSTDQDFTVRAYNTKTGKLLWQDQFDGTYGYEDATLSIAIKGTQVFVGGEVDNTDRDFDFTVRTYKANRGKLLWQDQVDGTYGMFDRVEAIAVSGKTVFAAGKVDNSATDEDFTVRAYNTKTGKLLWQDQFNGSANDKDQAKAIAATVSQVFVVGKVSNKSKGEDFTVRAYKAK